MQEERDGAEGRARPPFLLLPDYIIPPLNPTSRLLQNCRRKCLTVPYDMRLPMFCRSITLVYLVVFALARQINVHAVLYNLLCLEGQLLHRTDVLID